MFPTPRKKNIVHQSNAVQIPDEFQETLTFENACV